jgi:hypothetical protein
MLYLLLSTGIGNKGKHIFSTGPYLHMPLPFFVTIVAWAGDASKCINFCGNRSRIILPARSWSRILGRVKMLQLSNIGLIFHFILVFQS